MNRRLFFVLAIATAGCKAEVLDFDNGDASESLTGPDVASALCQGLDAQSVADTSVSVDATLDALPSPDVTTEASALFDADFLGDGSRRRRFDGGLDGGMIVAAFGECASQSDCDMLGFVCDLGDGSVGQCVECLTNHDCQTLSFPNCDLTLHRCVQCDVQSECPPDDVCLSAAHACVPSCASHICPAVVRATACEDAGNICLSCRTDDDCQPGTVCNPTTGQCVQCVTSIDCKTKPFLTCDRVTSRCVECIRNSDCEKGKCDSTWSCVGESVQADARPD